MKNFKRTLSKFFIIFIIIILTLTLTIGGYIGYIYYKDNYKKTNSNTEDLIELYIEKGESINSIASKLYDLKIISSPILFKEYGKLNNLVDSIKFGSHFVSVDMDYNTLYETISKSSFDNKNYIKVTIPEGYTVEQIADVLETNIYIDKNEFLELCKYGNFNYTFLDNIEFDEYIENSYKLEGFLFPDTYFINKDATSEEIIIMMLDRFNSVISKYDIEFLNEGYSMYDIIKIASIIERESKEGNERAIISSVFYNRLNKDIKLESCATVEYVLKTKKRVLSSEDISIDSLFNTYKYLGLPPTPISNPGESSIDAAFNPSDTEYLFFVSKKGTSEHAFAKTYNEHIANVKKYRD